MEKCLYKGEAAKMEEKKSGKMVEWVMGNGISCLQIGRVQDN
jgi:hypothetical protein